MVIKRLLLSVLAVAFLSFASARIAQSAPVDQRIAQPIIVNGQQVQGLTVVHNGVVQSFTCAAPQQYVAADQSSSGWTCFDESTGTWLMHAVPQTANVYEQYEQPPVYYPDTTVYGYYGYPYSYPYYDYPYYGYPFYGGPFAFGFGYGHGFYGHGGHFEHG